MFVKVIIALCVVVGVLGECEFQNCFDCVSNSCSWIETKGSAYCHTGRLPRSTYKLKIRSAAHCPEIPSTTMVPTSTLPQRIKEPVTPISQVRMSIPSTPSPSTSISKDGKKELQMLKLPIENVQNYQLDEAELKQEIDLHECRLYSTIRRLRKLKKGMPMTNEQFHRVVKNCLKTFDE